MKPGTEYELFVKEIYESILKCDGIDNINVQHDVKIKGASGVERQVDIFWEFELAGLKYKLVIECKDYRSAVPLEKIDAFHSKIVDIGGVTGVFVSKNGYQRGAIELAKKYGIQLREIRVPNDEDWDGYIRNIKFQIHCRSVTNVRPTITVDSGWAKSNNYHETNFHFLSNEVLIEDKTNGSQISILSMINELSREKIGPNQKNEFLYSNAYLFAGTVRIKITKLTLIYDVTESSDVVRICGDRLVKAIIHDVIAGETSSVHFDGTIIKRN